MQVYGFYVCRMQHEFRSRLLFADTKHFHVKYILKCVRFVHMFKTKADHQSRFGIAAFFLCVYEIYGTHIAFFLHEFQTITTNINELHDACSIFCGFTQIGVDVQFLQNIVYLTLCPQQSSVCDLKSHKIKARNCMSDKKWPSLLCARIYFSSNGKRTNDSPSVLKEKIRSLQRRIWKWIFSKWINAKGSGRKKRTRKLFPWSYSSKHFLGINVDEKLLRFGDLSVIGQCHFNLQNMIFQRNVSQLFPYNVHNFNDDFMITTNLMDKSNRWNI